MLAVMGFPFLASANFEPQCFVTVKVVGVGVEVIKPNYGEERNQHYLDFLVKEIQPSERCNVFEGKVYRVIDNHPGSILERQIILAGVDMSSTMGPEGVTSQLIWSSLKDKNGNAILDKKKKFEIGHVQGSDQPISRYSENIKE
jgi:hypothetical protein